jgi:hypothetical protein
MIRLPPIVHFASCLVTTLAAIGCRSPVPLPLPDAGRASGLNLSAEPNSLVIRPGGSGRIQFVLRDQQGVPVPNYPLAFAIPPDGSGDGTVDASLSSQQSLTDGSGAAVLEIIVGTLPNNDVPVMFSVAATSQGAAAAQADITVTSSAYSVEILPVPASDLLGNISIADTRVLFYDDATCGTLDLTDLTAATTKPRTARFANPGFTVVYYGVAASGSHAVVGLGLDGNATVQIGGCVDVPGASLLLSDTIRATLYMDRLFPVPTGTYQVASDFKLAPAPSALTAIQSVWRQWARCPLDPARLWVDCTLDALTTNATTDPLDCVPVTGAEGSLGDLLFPHRGTEVAPTSGTATNATDTPCRGPTDSAGDVSLEAIVDGLFGSARGQLTGAKLGALPDEIGGLLSDVRIDSQMAITAGSDVNSYAINHSLASVTFPNALTSISFNVPTLGLPVSSVSGILAALKAGQLSIPSHGFTLRLGTTARYAFEATSLKSRGAEDSSSLVSSVFGLAQLTDQGNVLSGCSALDAALCDQFNQARHCLLDACQSGLSALATKLARAFSNLDGTDLDFYLSGFAPVVDLDGDGRVDAMGQGVHAGIPTSPGLWSAWLDAQGGGSFIAGSWTASRLVNTP